MTERKFNMYLEQDGIQNMADIILDRGMKKIIVRNSCFLRQGQESDIIGYVRDGAFRHMLQTKDGSTKITGYSFAGDFLTAWPAFHTSGAAVTIQAIRKSTVYTMEREDLKKFISHELQCRIYESSLTDVYGRLLLMHAGSPEDRYTALISHYPAILDEVSLREIASFLRMAPETLSRLRKKILESKKS